MITGRKVHNQTINLHAISKTSSHKNAKMPNSLPEKIFDQELFLSDLQF